MPCCHESGVMKKRFAIFAFLLWSLVSAGQDTLRYHAFGLRHDNDINFFTDCYFTSGVELKWYWPQLSKSPLKYIMLPTSKGALTVYALTLTHHMYTPKEIFTPNLVPFDHPYSAYILMGQMQESYNAERKFKTTSWFQLGMIGPVAGGKAIQTVLHRNISIADPAEGWDNQIQNDICIQYTAEIENALWILQHLELISKVKFDLGVPRTQAIAGIMLRGGEMMPYFRGPETLGLKQWQFYGFTEMNLHLVNYNAVLQGGLFNHHNVHVLYNVNRYFWHFRYGATVVHKKFSVRYAVDVNSPTFATGRWHHWSELTLVLAY